MRSAAEHNFKSPVMSDFVLKGYSAQTTPRKPHFFILSRGLNSGKPLLQPCPNCFVLSAEVEERKQTLYWIAYSLWKTRAYRPHLVGSVIPFLRKDQCRKLISEAYSSVCTYPGALSKSIALLTDIEQKRQHFQAVSDHIGILHEAILFRLLHSSKKAR